MPPLLHFNRLGEWPGLAEREAVFQAAAVAALSARGEVSGEVSFTFVSSEEIRDLNRRYLERDRPTDVIAFQLGEGGDLLGDVYIAPEIAGSNADDRGEPHAREIARLVIHGALHVLGFDHPDDPDRESSPMFVLQEELLRSLTSG